MFVVQWVAPSVRGSAGLGGGLVVSPLGAVIPWRRFSRSSPMRPHLNFQIVGETFVGRNILLRRVSAEPPQGLRRSGSSTAPAYKFVSGTRIQPSVSLL